MTERDIRDAGNCADCGRPLAMCGALGCTKQWVNDDAARDACVAAQVKTRLGQGGTP